MQIFVCKESPSISIFLRSKVDSKIIELMGNKNSIHKREPILLNSLKLLARGGGLFMHKNGILLANFTFLLDPTRWRSRSLFIARKKPHYPPLD